MSWPSVVSLNIASSLFDYIYSEDSVQVSSLKKEIVPELHLF